MIQFLAGSFLSELGIVLKEPYTIPTPSRKTLFIPQLFIHCPVKFFHNEPIFKSFIRLWRDLSDKNLIILDAIL